MKKGMANFVVNNAQIKCSFGDFPSSLGILPDKNIQGGNQPMANIMDFQPIVNIKPFGQCKSIANPTVAAATAASLGVLHPMPCIPNTVAPWTPGNPKALVKEIPALMDDCKLMCMWAGIIEVSNAGQTIVVK
jgi:hypothetical protein